MMKSDLHPPHAGLDADPVLYGIAAGLAELFPPVLSHAPCAAELDRTPERDDDRELRDHD